MISAPFLLPGSKGVPCREGAGEDAEFWPFSGFQHHLHNLLLASRLSDPPEGGETVSLEMRGRAARALKKSAKRLP